jgi:hypothetical protein
MQWTKPQAGGPRRRSARLQNFIRVDDGAGLAAAERMPEPSTSTQRSTGMLGCGMYTCH